MIHQITSDFLSLADIKSILESNSKLELSNELNIPTFLADSKIFIRRITLIVEKKIIKKVFYPINDISKHIEEVLKWLKEN